jgi:uncharacterized protein
VCSTIRSTTSIVPRIDQISYDNQIAPAIFAGANRGADLVNDPGSFTWYELITTDLASAASFYRDVVGWETKPLSTSQPAYTLFTADGVEVAGLMELPEEGRKMGAMPRWMGYIRVVDIHAVADRIKRLGGAVYVPPTDTNIGRISVAADPNTATFAVADRLQAPPQQPNDSGKPGRIGWQELLAADLDKQIAFYCELFGWQKAYTDNHLTDARLSFFAGAQVIGGALKKRPDDPVPFWLFYFNVEDLDAAVERVRAGGGQAFLGDEESPSGLSVAHCLDAQGAAFGLQGRQAYISKVGWRTEWQGFSSRGRLVAPKPRRS